MNDETRIGVQIYYLPVGHNKQVTGKDFVIEITTDDQLVNFSMYMTDEDLFLLKDKINMALRSANLRAFKVNENGEVVRTKNLPL